MRDTDYAFCVARIRANEANLLTTDFVGRLIECVDYNEADKMLCEKGWMTTESSIAEAVKSQNQKLWQLLCESVPDKKELDSLCVLNDCFNVKTAVKCIFTGDEAENYFVYPTSLDLEQLTKDIKALNFKALPENIAGSAEKAYDIANKTENGQYADIIIDKATLEILAELAEKSRNKIFSDVCTFTADTTNMKIALRCARTRKNKDFAESAISNCKHLDRSRLIELCTDSEEQLYEYLLSSKYSDGVTIYKESPAAFDKWCDDKIIEIVKDAKYTAFGFSPVCAYYYAKQTEIKTVRIILMSKLSGVSKDVIRERVRALYV